MNLIFGRLVNCEESIKVLPDLQKMVIRTQAGGCLDRERLLRACQRLSENLDEDAAYEILKEHGIGEEKARRQIREARKMLERSYLEQKLHRELGEYAQGEGKLIGLEDGRWVRQKTVPLGTLLHIAAGNMEGLAAFSVLEGLLAGNINLLKLPGKGDEISVVLLKALIRLEPCLQEYIYVFDFSSTDLKSMMRLAEVADGIVVWGGDEAVRSVRTMAHPDTAIIEWGHKLSFAYVTEEGSGSEEELRRLAAHICDTDQLLCSSCQGIFLDTLDAGILKKFAEGFLKILEAECSSRDRELSPFIQGQITLKLRSLSLGREAKIYMGKHCSVAVYKDSCLEQAIGFCNLWVKRLAGEEIIVRLKGYKNRLQTVGMICGPEEWDRLSERFFAAGTVNVVDVGRMSAGYCGMPHDGEFALRRYVRVVEEMENESGP